MNPNFKHITGGSVFIGALFAAFPTTLFAQTTPNFILACVAKDGTTRLIDPATVCKVNEKGYQLPLLNRLQDLEGRVSTNESLDVAQQDALTAQNNTIGTLQGQVSGQGTSITALQGQVSGQGTSITALQGQVSGQGTSITALQGQVSTQATNIATLQSELAATPASFTSYLYRSAFSAAAGATTNINFNGLPPGSSYYSSLTLSGVTFNNFASYYQQAITINSNPVASVRIDLPAGTRAVGADLASFYGDPGIFTMALSTGQESTTVSASGFLGIVSAEPIAWIVLKYYSACLPSTIYGQATCPSFPAGYAPGVLVIRNFTFGPGN